MMDYPRIVEIVPGFIAGRRKFKRKNVPPLIINKVLVANLECITHVRTNVLANLV